MKGKWKKGLVRAQKISPEKIDRKKGKYFDKKRRRRGNTC